MQMATCLVYVTIFSMLCLCDAQFCSSYAQNCETCVSSPLYGDNSCYWCASTGKCLSRSQPAQQCSDPYYFNEMCTDTALTKCIHKLPTVVDHTANNCQACIDVGCVFIKKGYYTITQPERSDDIEVINETCWKALPLVGTLLSSEVHRSQGVVYKVTATESYYASCQMRDYVYWLTIGASFLAFILLLFLFLLCCICCCGRCCRSKSYSRIN
jgi:hypothetical protein